MKKRFTLISMTIFLFGISACQTLPERKPIQKDGKMYGITEGAFRHNWWNYYERALSFADGGFWEEAQLDLQDALKFRNADQRRARTYGMHFVDYFPHRELGIVFYNKKLYDQALKELEDSLKMEKSAKAELYLDRVRKTLIEERRLDKTPPQIQIKAPMQPLVTNAFSVAVEGVAKDDTYVRTISVGNKTVRIDVSAQEIPFKVDMPVNQGENRITVTATDLSGKSSQSPVLVKVVRQGPVLRIDEPADDEAPSDSYIVVKGYAFAEPGLDEMIINGRKISLNGSQEIEIQEQTSLKPEEKQLEIKIRDRAGNITTARIALSRTGEKTLPGTPPQKDTIPPTIQIRDLKPEYTTYLDQAFIEGSIKDNTGVAGFFINDRQILKAPGKNIYFSHLEELKEGENIVNFRGIDQAGNIKTETLKIKRDVLKVHQTGSRLRVAVNQFEKTSIGQDQQLSFGLEDSLSAAMLKRARFYVIERRNLKAVLDEQKLSLSGLVDERKALEIGKLLAADDMLLGSVLERANSLEVYMRLVDTETAEMIAAVDMYGEDIDVGALRALSQGLDLRLTEELPLLEGMVMKADGSRFAIDLGRRSQIKRGTKVIVFDVGGEIVHPVTKKVMGLDVRELGEGKIESVMEDMSFVELSGKSGNAVVQPMLRVITR